MGAPTSLLAVGEYGGNKIPFGLQLYSVRNECAKDLPGTLSAVAKMGYKAVEFAGYHGRDAKTLRKMLDDLGIKCCGTHLSIDALLGDPLIASAFNGSGGAGRQFSDRGGASRGGGGFSGGARGGGGGMSRPSSVGRSPSVSRPSSRICSNTLKTSAR